ALRVGQHLISVVQQDEFLLVARLWVVRMKPARHKSVDTLDRSRFGFRTNLEEFIIVDFGATRSGHGSPGFLGKFEADTVSRALGATMSNRPVAVAATV